MFSLFNIFEVKIYSAHLRQSLVNKIIKKTSRENKKILSLQFLAGTGIKIISCGATLLDAFASTLTY